MHPNLMHSSGERPAEHHTGSTIKAQTLELSFTFLSMRRDFANTNLVTYNFYWLCALSQPPIH